MSPLVYIAGPYTHPDPVANTRRAIWVGDALLDDGLVTPIIPHLTMFWDVVAPRPYDEWLRYDLRVLEHCDAVLRLSGESTGADREVAHAQEHGIPVFEVLDELLAWASDRAG